VTIVTGVRNYLGHAWHYQRWRLSIWLVGVATLFIGGPRLAGSSGFLLGALLIAVAVAPWPSRAERYRRHLARALREASRLSDAALRGWDAAQIRHLKELRDLTAPARLAADADALAATLDAARRHSAQPAPFTERALELLALRLRRETLQQQIAAHAGTAEERRYSEALAAILNARKRENELLRREAERALTGLMARLEQLQAPERLHAQHEQLRRALLEEYEAMSAYYQATEGSDSEAVRRTAGAYEQASEARTAALQAAGVPVLRPRT
jgi:hypothetical protein